MTNLTGTINLMKLSNAALVVNGSGRKCICIPIEENDIFCNDKGCYLSITAWDNGAPDAYGKTHRIKQSFSKEYRERNDVKGKPILGNFKALAIANSATSENVAPTGVTTPKVTSQGLPKVDDMPF
jgi:hypothetical protein